MPAQDTITRAPTSTLERPRGRWRRRPGLAAALSVLWFTVHFVVAAVVTFSAAVIVGRPGSWPLTLGWFLGLGWLSFALLVVTQRLARRLLPMRSLLRLTLAFPGEVPSRFGTALRSGSLAAIRRRIERGGQEVRSDDPPAPEDPAAALLQLVGALADHDASTRGHSERVRAYTELIAEEMDLAPLEREHLRWGGLVHDVGKLRIPAEVLNKTGPLTDLEWELIRRHPEDGAELARPLAPWLGEAADAVLDHHERWEGGGYPHGVAGEDISLAGRIVAVADAFDVMTSARSYKKPRPAHEAREEIVRCSGTQFDPDVVRAFLGVSVRRLRKVIGPLAFLTQFPAVEWHLARFNRTAVTAALAAGMAVTSGILAPATGGGGGGGTGGVPAAVGGESGSGVVRVPQVLSAPPGLPASAVLSDGVRHSPMDTPAPHPQEAATGHDTPGPSGTAEKPEPSAGDGPTTNPGPDRGRGGADETGPDGAYLSVDPGAGRVAVDGLGADETGSVEAVDRPGAGSTVCSTSGACQEIVVDIPG